MLKIGVNPNNVIKALAVVFAVGYIFSFTQVQAATTIGANISTDGYLKIGTAVPGTPVVGMIYYDSGTNKFRCYEGAPAGWVDCVGGVSGTLPVSQGGTGLSSYTVGDLIYATGATTLSKLGVAGHSNGDILTISGGLPTWTSADPLVLTNTYVHDTLNGANPCTGESNALVGDVCIATVDNKTYILQTGLYSASGNWKELLADDSQYLLKSSNLSDVANTATARGNLGAAKSGANSDITSLSGLTTALSVGQGGTGLTSLGTGNQMLGVNAAGTALEYKTISGTSNRVSVTNGAGTITLSGPQDIHTGATPQFAGLTLTGNLNIDNQTELRLSELDANGANYIALKAPGTLAGDLTYTLPATYGTNGDVLASNGSGGLSWTAVSGTISNGTTNNSTLRWDSGTTAWKENTSFLVTSAGAVSSGTWNGSAIGIAYGGTNNTSAYTAGSVIFSNGTSLTQSNADLFWDDTNKRLGIGDTTPVSALTVGSGDKFQVDSSGNLVKLNNVTYNWPGSQGGSTTYLQNDGSGNLSWGTPAGSGDITYVGDVATGDAFRASASGTTSDGNSLWFEGSTIDANEIQLSGTDPLADVTVMLPASNGTLLLNTNNLSDVSNIATARGNLGAAASGANSDITGLTGLNLQNAIQINPYNTGAGQTGELRFLELAGAGTNYVGFKSPDSISSSLIWTLPSGIGTTGQVLTLADNAGTLSWSTPSASGITSLGGQTGATQTFANGTSGTAPGWSSGSNIHTLNIPMASSAGTTAGLLSKTDYDSFAGKQNSLTIGNLSTSTTGVTIGSGTGAVIGSGTTVNISTASGSSTGLLSSADWTTFNSKQNALTIGNLTAGSSKITLGGSGTGAVIGSGVSVDVNEGNLSLNNIGGTLGVTKGGLGLTSIGTGEIIYGSAPNTYTALAAGTSGYLLQANGAAAPSWLNVSGWDQNASNDLTTSSNLNDLNDVVIGGVAGGDILWYNSTNTRWENLADGNSGQVLTSNGTGGLSWTTPTSTPNFEGVYGADGDQTLTTSNGAFTIATGTGVLTLNSASSGNVNIGTGTNTGTITLGNSTSTAVKIGKLTTNGVVQTSNTDGTLGIAAVNLGSQVTGNLPDSNLATITTANKVSGSAVQLSATGGLTNNTGLSLLTSCTNGQVLSWNNGSSSWVCTTPSSTPNFEGVYGADGDSTLTTSNGSFSINSGTGAINIGTDAAAKTITIGNGTLATSLVLNAGTGNIDIGANAAARTINLGTGSAAQAVTVGSTNTTSSTTIQSGSGALNIQSGTGTTSIGTTGTGAVAIGNSTGTFTLTSTGGLNVSSGGQLTSSLGSAGAPTYSFTGDVNTGIYSSGADTLDLSTGGTSRLSVSTTGTTSNLPITMAYNNALVFNDSSLPGTASIIAPSAISSAYTLTLPTAVGTSGQVLSLADNTGTLSWATVSGGVGANSLDFTEFQDTMALDAATTIQLASSTYALNFDAETASTTYNDAITVTTTGASASITDAIDVSDAEIVNALNVGANTITGGAAVIDFTNFDVSGAGVVTAGSTINGLTLSSTTLSAAGALTVSSAGSGALTLDSDSATIILGTGTNAINTTGATALSIDTGAAAALNLGTANANAISIGKSGINTTLNGNLLVAGATSGNVNISVPATVTTYPLVLPSVQGGSNTFLRNDGSGNLSWAAAGTGTITAVGDITTGAAFTQTTGADGNSLYFEGTGAGDSNEVQLTTAANPSGDVIVNIPVTAGTLLLNANNLSDVSNTSTARGNLGAAASGANGDITSMTAVTSITSTGALSVTSGGTNQNLTLDSSGTGSVLIGNGLSAKTITIGNSTGATALILNTGSGGITLSSLGLGIVHSSAGGLLSSSAVGLASGDVTGILPLANGGTNANLTASNGGIFYSTGSAGAILAGTATANQILLSGASTTPSWSTATYPSTAGLNGNVLTSDGTNWVSSAPSFTEADTLQTVYNRGNSISLATAKGDLLVNLGDDLGNAFVIDANAATTFTDAIAITTSNASGVITDAIDVSDAEIANALNVGANTITGGAAVIDFTNFDVSGAGAVTAGSTINGLTLNSTTLSAAGALTVSSAGSGALTLDSDSATIVLGTGTNAIATTGATALSVDTGGAAAINIGTTNANAITLSKSGGASITLANLTSAGIVHNNASGLLSSSAVSLTADVTGVLPGTNGGTGVNNGANTITLGGNLTTSGANNVTFTTTGLTNVTLPTSGTLLSDTNGWKIGGNATGGAATLGTTDNSALTILAGTGTLGIATDATSETVNVGTGAGVKALTLGSTNTTSATTLQSGTGALNIQTQGTGGLNIGANAVAQTITIGNSTGATSLVLNNGTGAFNLGSNATDHTTTLGSVTGTSATTVQSGTGGLTLTSTGAGTVSLDSGTSGNVNLGIGNNAKTINIGTGTAGNAINIGTNNTTADNIGIGSVLDTLTINGTTINVGPTGSGASSIVLSGGSGDTGCTINGATGALTCTGNITSTGGSVGYWTDSGTTLSPSSAGRNISTTGNITTTSTGTMTSAGLLTASNGLTMTTGAAAISANSASSLTTSSGALTLTSAAAATWSTASGQQLTLQSGSGTLSLGSTTALTATAGLAISSGGTGVLSLDTSGAAALNIGNTNATSLSIGRTGVTTTNNGSFTSTQTLTASNGLTMSTGALNLTATSGSLNLTTTSGALAISGLSASSISAGANALTLVGAPININNTGSGITNIGVGSTGAINIGNSSSGAITITSGASVKIGNLATQYGVLYTSATDGTLAQTSAGTSGYCLTSNGPGAAPTFQICGAGGGANTALSNLATVAINTSLLPGTTNSINLGSDTFNWSNLYLGSGGIIFEGTSNDANETTLAVTDPTADRTLTLPNYTGNIVGSTSNYMESGTTGAIATGTVTTNFANTFASAPKVVITPTTSAQFTNNQVWPYVSATSTTSFTITASATYNGATFNWVAVGTR